MSNRSVYGCHSDTAGPEPRGRTTEYWVQDGWIHVTGTSCQPSREPVMRKVRTEFQAMRCGVLPQVGVPADPNCVGCLNRIGGDDGA